MNLGRTSYVPLAEPKWANAVCSIIVFDPVKDVATVLLPHVSASTRMERRSTQTRPLLRLPRHKVVVAERERWNVDCEILLAESMERLCEEIWKTGGIMSNEM